MQKIRIRDHPEYEFIKDENDFVSLVDTYLGEDAKVYLEDLINDYKNQIADMKNNTNEFEEFRNQVISFVENW